jgi:hypothetical protein
MAKMYLSEEEACQALGVDQDGLMDMVNDERLQMYRDGAKNVFKSVDIEALAAELGGGSAGVEEAPEGIGGLAASVAEESASYDGLDDLGTIEMSDESGSGEGDLPSPAIGDNFSDTINSDELDLEGELESADASAPATPRKEDTVITASGISIFDDEDLEIEEADPMAETQIAPSLEDDVALDGVGSGSGLLDLTRESDDTSLGAEVLDHIDIESGSGLASGLASGLSSGLASGLGSALADEAGGDSGLAELSTTTPSYTSSEPPTYVEAVDSTSGLFTGLLIGAAGLMLLMMGVTLAAHQGTISSLLNKLQTNVTILVGASAVLMLMIAVAGLLIGKTIQAKRSLQQG